MGNVDIAIKLPDECIFSKLVSVDEGAIDLESKDEFAQFGLDFGPWLFCAIVQRSKHAERIGASRVHSCYSFLVKCRICVIVTEDTFFPVQCERRDRDAVERVN